MNPTQLAIVPEIIDYLNDNNLLTCGYCHTPKQIRLRDDSVVKIPCSCEQARLEQKEAQKEAAAQALKNEKTRNECFQNNPRYKMATFQNDDHLSTTQTQICLQYAQTFTKEDPTGLLLYGNVGTGKSYMSAAIANHLIDQGNTAIFTDISTIATELEQSFENRTKIMKKLLTCDILCLEDIGSERNTEYMYGILYSIIDGRYKAQKPMIITTNIPLETMSHTTSTASQRIYDRILETCYPIQFTTQRRRQNAIIMRQNMRKRLQIQ